MDERVISVENYGQKKGFELRAFSLKCIQDGNWAAIEKVFYDEQTLSEMISAVGTDLEFVRVSLFYVWAQEEQSAVIGGADEVEVSRMAFQYYTAARQTDSVRELFELHLQLMKDYAEAVARENEKRGKYAPVLRAIRYIKDHLYDRLSPDRLAEEIHFSAGHLSRLFKQYTGETIISYIQRERIAEAKRLLTHTSLSVTEISTDLGYCSQSYFTSVFKKSEGVTPREYREAQK